MQPPVSDPVSFPEQRIAAIVPCHNEEQTVAAVVRDLRLAVPEITVYVYDNNSSDHTADRARAAGAIVRSEARKGKGNVLRRAFADIDADIYVTIDGDDTYEAAALPRMIEALLEGPYDHVLGVRSSGEAGSYRPGHEMGNRMFNRMVSLLFRSQVSDMLSGYRVFSRRFVKSFPAVSKKFEIETELTVHMTSLRLPQVEVDVGFGERPPGSESKLHTYSDGFKILYLMVQLVRHERPALFHGIIAAALALVSLGLGLPVVLEYFQTGFVPRFPTAILAAAFMGLAVLVGCIGIILDGLKRGRREAARLAYLRLDPPPHPQDAEVLPPDPQAAEVLPPDTEEVRLDGTKK